MLTVPAQWKGKRISVVYCHKYTDFTQNFAWFTAWRRFKPLISSAIENKVNKGLLRSCGRSYLRLLRFNVPQCCPLQAYCTVEMRSSLIFVPFVPARLGVTGRRMDNIPRATTHYCDVLAKACANRALVRSFSSGRTNTRAE